YDLVTGVQTCAVPIGTRPARRTSQASTAMATTSTSVEPSRSVCMSRVGMRVGMRVGSMVSSSSSGDDVETAPWGRELERVVGVLGTLRTGAAAVGAAAGGALSPRPGTLGCRGSLPFLGDRRGGHQASGASCLRRPLEAAALLARPEAQVLEAEETHLPHLGEEALVGVERHAELGRDLLLHRRAAERALEPVRHLLDEARLLPHAARHPV